MCHHLITLAKNEFKQSVHICEHDTLHLVHHHTTIAMSRQSFHKLSDFLASRCLNKKQDVFSCKVSGDDYVEFWIGKGAFKMIPAELIALATLVEKVSAYLQDMPISELIKPKPLYQQNPVKIINFSQN